MLVIKATARVTADSLDPIVDQVKEIRTRSLKRRGVLGYDFFRQDDDHVVALEVYEDSDVLIAHMDAGGFDELFKLIEIERIEVNDLRRRVSMVFQQPNPFPMSIFENVAYALRERTDTPPPRRDRKRRGRRGRRALEPAVIAAVRRAGLYDEVADDLDRPALRLSGGQQQRLCIARALAAGPEVLLLDEPCSALDPISTATIEEQIVGLRDSVAIVIVTHNLQQAMRVADHVAFMHLGELVEYGTSEQVFERPTEQRTREYISGAFG